MKLSGFYISMGLLMSVTFQLYIHVRVGRWSKLTLKKKNKIQERPDVNVM